MHRRPTVLPPTEEDSSSSNTKNPNGKVKANEKVNTMFKWRNICSFLFISMLIGIIIALNIERQGNIEALLYWKQKETQWKEESSLASALRLDMKTLLQEKDRLKEDSAQFEGAIEKLSRTIEELKSENNSLKKQMKDDAKVLKSENDSLKKQKKDDEQNLLGQIKLIQSQLTHLKQKVQSSARVAVLEKFGPGPYLVEFKLDFPPEEQPPGDADRFVIEMAPLDLMPYTVNFFLNQVSKQLYDGTSFHRNAGHVVQGGPAPNHLSKGGINLRKRFMDDELGSVAFQEYNDKFPHVKYTLGFAGRPGGPDFYVSTIDNTKNHGPGGQASYAIASEADPCFAKVIEGFDAVDRMHLMRRKPGGYQAMEHNVAIKYARIIPNEQN